jgi:hypothetical protein
MFFLLSHNYMHRGTFVAVHVTDRNKLYVIPQVQVNTSIRRIKHNIQKVYVFCLLDQQSIKGKSYSCVFRILVFERKGSPPLIVFTTVP